ALALMVGDLSTARMLCRLSPGHEALLVSPEKPIVLCPRLETTGLAPEVAPDTATLGLMLPYTPLH
ncbi:MAG: Sua5/YciO/YrdC/YwlC family protein, partial [Desulfovibrionaceae bacterium]|nr:Sua5/YciO/YrdC/YwlC family protein [Desulfovibrionaceae bacterium]